MHLLGLLTSKYMMKSWLLFPLSVHSLGNFWLNWRGLIKSNTQNIIYLPTNWVTIHTQIKLLSSQFTQPSGICHFYQAFWCMCTISRVLQLSLGSLAWPNGSGASVCATNIILWPPSTFPQQDGQRSEPLSLHRWHCFPSATSNYRKREFGLTSRPSSWIL